MLSKVYVLNRNSMQDECIKCVEYEGDLFNTDIMKR